jgi:hypothetical protein
MNLSVAFKEWAAICAALAAGRQSVILRKGGIAEEGGLFRPEHSEFLLYPTYFHEHRAGVKLEFLPLLEAAETARAAVGTIRFSHFVRVSGARRLTTLEDALALDDRHAWTPEVVSKRFNYRTPGLFALDVSVFRLREPALRPERPEYAGCKTWVMLDDPVPVDGAAPSTG